MGRPQIKYENVTEGSISTVEAVKGVGLMILKDDTIATKIKNYKNFAQVLEAEYTANNFQRILDVYSNIHQPSELIIIRIPSTGSFTDATKIIEKNAINFNYGVFPEATKMENTAAISWVQSHREDTYNLKFWHWIVHIPNTIIDKIYIHNLTTTNIELEDRGVISTGDFLPRLLGLRCGVPFTQSLIKFSVQFKDVKSFDLPADPDLAIDNGEIILIRNRQCIPVIADDINTFITFIPTQDYRMSRSDIIDRIDHINETLVLTYEKRVRGVMTTGYNNKAIVSQAFTSFLKKFAREGNLEQTFNNRTVIDLDRHKDIVVALGEDPNAYSEIQLLTIDTGVSMYFKNIIRCPGVAKDLEFITFLTTTTE